MYLRPHENATCKNCGSDEMLYGTKEEATGYKVYYLCDDCGREWMMGKVMKDEIEDEMEINANAEKMAP